MDNITEDQSADFPNTEEFEEEKQENGAKLLRVGAILFVLFVYLVIFLKIVFIK